MTTPYPQSQEDSRAELAERGYANLAEMRRAIDELERGLRITRRDRDTYEAKTVRQATEINRLNDVLDALKEKEKQGRRRRNQLWIAANSALLMLQGEPAPLAKTTSAVDELVMALKHGVKGDADASCQQD